MNVTGYEAFNAFAVDYFSKKIDVRFSLLLARVNVYWHSQTSSYIWKEVRKIYSLNKEETSNEELKNRMLTDLINVCQPFKNLEGEIDYTYFPIKQLGFEEISCIHYYARVKYEKMVWCHILETEVTYKSTIPAESPNAWSIDYPVNEAEKEKFRNTAQIIDECIKNNKEKFIYAVQLKAEGLPLTKFSALPIEILFFTGLKKLYLSDNKLCSLPIEIQNLRNLIYIDLKSNCIKNFPEALCNLPLLDSINLSDNLIDTIPDKIINLRKLKHLTLTKNKIEFISDSLKNLSLKTLNLLNNPIHLLDIKGKVWAENLYINGQIKKSEQILLKKLELEKQQLREQRQPQNFEQLTQHPDWYQPQLFVPQQQQYMFPHQQFVPHQQQYMFPHQQFVQQQQQYMLPTQQFVQQQQQFMLPPQQFVQQQNYMPIQQEIEIDEEIPFFSIDKLEEPVGRIKANKRDNPFDDSDKDNDLKKTRHQ